MAAEYEGGDIAHRDAEFEAQEVTEAGAVEHAGHAADHVVGQAGEFAQGPDHRVERVGDADHKGVGRVFLDAFADGFHDLEVDAQQVVAAHPRFARHTGGDDADVGPGDIGIGLGALERGVEAFGGAGFRDVEGFALGHAFGNVEQHWHHVLSLETEAWF